MFEDFIVQQNIHWNHELYESGVKRECFDELKDYLLWDQIIALTGVRRAGKSTVMKQLINYLIQDKKIDVKNILFLNLEHPHLAAHAESYVVLQNIYETYLKLTGVDGLVYIFLDEVQFIRQWPVFVKSLFEKKKAKFIITGSNASMLSSDLLTLLSGRTVETEIYPFSFRELIWSHGIDVDNKIELLSKKPRLSVLLEEMLIYGGLPVVATNSNKQLAYEVLGAHARMVLLQDVSTRLGVRKPLDLEKLYVYLVSSVSRLFSYNSLSNLFNLSDKSIKEYIHALIEAYMIFEVEEFAYSIKKQIRSLKKIYAIDTGQAKAMGFEFSPNKGRFLENLLFLQFKRLKLDIFYYKTKKDLEIDFVLKKNLDLAVVQIAWEVHSSQTYEREVRAIEEAKRELNIDRAALIVFEKPLEEISTEKNIILISAQEFLLKNKIEQMQILFG